ncbi:hypothetical protein MROS_2366 [Melioribacter roseus P3M-2]|uniref:Uncharacterized protein n=1 Tax=Melioribacter roseus (strain DSM 23840 / JCM 17771 / VKM B-2668 / P3M-2) TaxID=1191523 RepID=I7A6T9_MELRP|nr:hypothetical protein [Melioribacter roseus]AFN75596.1 hypothetical protein MROS_2366 [Melioribacter roseus P3M-2]
MNCLDELKNSKVIFLNFMKGKYPIEEKSNIFLRDLQYAIKAYFESKGKKLSYTESEKLAYDFADYLVGENILKKISNNAWFLNFLPSDNVTDTAA